MSSSGSAFAKESTSSRVRQPRRPSRSSCLPVIVAFLFGLLLGGAGIAGYIFLLVGGGDLPPVATSPTSSPNDAVIAQVRTPFIAQLITQNIKSAGLPGTVKNVQVTLTHNGPLVVMGDDQFGVLGINFTRHFTVQVQPFIQTCRLRVHVLHADLQGIPITGFASSFEESINQQLGVNVEGLPKGFTYCLSAVRTEPEGVYVTYSAIPV